MQKDTYNLGGNDPNINHTKEDLPYNISKNEEHEGWIIKARPL